MRILCFLFVLLSVVIALLNNKFNIAAIAYMMGISWGTLAGCFIGPFVLGVIWRKVTKPAVWTSIISSLVLTVGLVIFFGFHKNGFDCSFAKALKDGVGTSPLIGVICMIFSIIITVVVSLMTKPPKEETKKQAFEKKVIE